MVSVLLVFESLQIHCWSFGHVISKLFYYKPVLEQSYHEAPGREVTANGGVNTSLSGQPVGEDDYRKLLVLPLVVDASLGGWLLHENRQIELENTWSSRHVIKDLFEFRP